MKAYLMYRDGDFDLHAPQPAQEDALLHDLELPTLFAAMGAGDKFLQEVAHAAVLASLDDPEAIVYRQRILADCLENAAVVREMYGIAVEALEREKTVWAWGSDRYPEGLLHRSGQVMQIFVELLRKLRRVADERRAGFRSAGFTALFDMLTGELGDAYLAGVEEHLRRLGFRGGVLMSAELGPGNKGAHYVLRAQYADPTWLERLIGWTKERIFREQSGFVYQVGDRDESGLNALEELRNRGISLVAAALAQSTDHVLSFFSMLRLELAFYVGCLNLHEQLAQKGEPTCFPQPVASGGVVFTGRGLYDPCLSLSVKERVAGNDVRADGKLLVMITGANRGGKSTFLRSAGIAQLMMQAGMFVAAEAFRANIRDRLFTHFKREEDAGMRSGKFDEELHRMSAIVDDLTPRSMMLFNESFASTNEREGSEIARQIVRALLEKGIKVFYVTHLFDLAHGFYLAGMENALFLRAERLADGGRTFRVVEGEPLPTSYGPDLYRRIFNSDGGKKTEA